MRPEIKVTDGKEPHICSLSSREAFERWALKNWGEGARPSVGGRNVNMNGLNRNLDDLYIYRPIQDAWEAWQAAWQAFMEAAGRRAEG